MDGIKIEDAELKIDDITLNDNMAIPLGLEGVNKSMATTINDLKKNINNTLILDDKIIDGGTF